MKPVAHDLEHAISAFLYTEARFLEDNRFDDWLDCLADDVRYWMPPREHVEGQVGKDVSDHGFALYDDDKESLTLRVLRIKTGFAHAEVPLSVTHRQITNVMAMESGKENEFDVSSSFLIHQVRRGRHEVTWYGRRADVLRLADGRIRIARRRIDLSHTILPATISIFL